jgi:TRAP-type uncharacterized transport system fused permease subunit
VITAFIGVLLLGSSLEGYLIGVGKLNYLLRAIFGLAGLLTFVPEIYTDMIGLGLAGATYGVIFVRRRSQKQVAIMLQSNTERR